MSLLTTKDDIQKAIKKEYPVKLKRKRKYPKNPKPLTSYQVAISVSMTQELQRLLDRD